MIELCDNHSTAMMVQNTYQTSSTNSRRRRRRSRSSRRQQVHIRTPSSLESIPEDLCKESFANESCCSPVSAFFADESDPLALVNHERARRNLPPMKAASDLYQLAEKHCQNMADHQTVFHSVRSIDELVAKVQAPHAAESIQRGDSVLDMHYETLSQRRSVNYCNVVSTVFTEFGAAACRGSDGKMYLCQLFRN